MLNKLKQAVEASMDAVAPPPSFHEDFVYHWKRFLKHYMNLSYDHKAAVELTNLPGCLDRLREILVNEDEEISKTSCNSEIGPCMEYLLKNTLLDLLVSLAISDEPPGMKSCILRFISKTLTQLKEPNIAHSAMYVPLMKLMNVCDGLLHSVSEADEIEFLLHLCAVLRKQPAIAMLFFSNESTKTLEETTEDGDSIQYGNILDLVLTYVDSADSGIRVKACQCIQLMCSLDDEMIVQHIVNSFKFNHFIIGRLTTLFFEVPPTHCEQFKNIEASWTLDIPQESQLEVIKNRSAIIFFSWVDFINQLSLECHEMINDKLTESVTNYFLNESFRANFLSSPTTLAIFCKYYRMISSPALQNGFQKWLIEKGGQDDVLNITTNPILQILLNHCQSKNEFMVTTSLDFFMEVLDRCDEQIIYNIVLCYIRDRSYYNNNAVASSWSDEEDERQKYSSSPEALSSSRTLAPSKVDKIAQSFVNIVPTQIRTHCSEDTVHYLQKQYDEIISRCSEFKWPKEAISDVESLSNDSNPESDRQNKQFYEGPFLKMLFAKIRHFPQLTLEHKFSVTAIVSRLALLPHPFLHEYLLNPLLPLRRDVPSLYMSLRYVMNDVSSRVQMIVNYENELHATKERLLLDDISSIGGEIDRYLEACILLEELCNELASTAYVKYAHSHATESDKNMI